MGGHALGSMVLPNASVALRVCTWESEYVTAGSFVVLVVENIVASWMWPLISPAGLDMVGVRKAFWSVEYLSWLNQGGSGIVRKGIPKSSLRLDQNSSRVLLFSALQVSVLDPFWIHTFE